MILHNMLPVFIRGVRWARVLRKDVCIGSRRCIVAQRSVTPSAQVATHVSQPAPLAPATPSDMRSMYAKLMEERSLKPNASQKRLVGFLSDLQEAVMGCEAAGHLAARRDIGYSELLEQVIVKSHAPSYPSAVSAPSGMSAFSRLIAFLQGAKAPAQTYEQESSGPSQCSDNVALSQMPYHSCPNLRCLYIWGGVGQGKTMLMDAFFNSTPLKKKSRHHFHTFMLDIQQQLHLLKNQTSQRQTEQKNGSLPDLSAFDPLLQVAYRVASETKLLCLDEFQVVHIADAVILKRLIESLWHFGCVVVVTSNRPPADLYKGGLNRDRFIPFIDLVQTHWTVFHIDAAQDFRQQKRVLLNTPCTQRTDSRDDELLAGYYCPPRPLHSVLSQLSRLAQSSLSHDVCKSPSAERIAVAMGRYLDAPYAVDGLCCFPFSTLCDAAVGAADFIALAERYNTLFLYNVESLENFDERPHEIRRFIELIDVLYERCNRVIFDSRVPLLKVFGDTHVTKSFDALLNALRTRYPNGLEPFFVLLQTRYLQLSSAPMNEAVFPQQLEELVQLDNPMYGKEVTRVLWSGVTALQSEEKSTTPADTLVKQNFISLFYAALSYYVQFGCQDKALQSFVLSFDATKAENAKLASPNNLRLPQFNFGSSAEPGVLDDAASSGSQDNRFAAERCISRIRDMLSEDYERRHQETWNC